ncbi:hypothetical protein [Priestia megaterium]|uniref:hypothetical protein n=1 Tax=Priestia megaterium TaxID=1404 RepID=UPI001127AA24|nr:hypothetical protein [Priestia megaterium]TPF17976.1 hypothetical protein CBE78_01760 [Priestia megaterium]TPF22084.1 hypothetical protein CBE79_04265 [Priestia megaterium]
MNVLELKNFLDELIKDGKGELEIVMSKDAEGNAFNRLDTAQLDLCNDENEPVNEEDIGEYYEREDLTEKVIIWCC